MAKAKTPSKHARHQTTFTGRKSGGRIDVEGKGLIIHIAIIADMSLLSKLCHTVVTKNRHNMY